MTKKLNLNDYKAFVFDFDGTLVDSLGLWHDIDIAYLSRFNLEVPEDLGDAINGMSFTETAQYFKDRFKLPISVEHIKQDWIDMSHDYYMNSIEFKPGAQEILEYLDDRPIGLATSNQAFTTERFFRNKGIKNIDTFSYSCDVEKGKPFPYIFLRAAESLNIDPKDCLAFEDTYEGVLAAKRARMTVVSVEDKYSKAQEEKIRELSDYHISDFRELI